MVGFRRVFMVLFLSFATIMLFIFLIRLYNNKDGFLGLRDLFNYFERDDVDFYKPLTNFTDTFTGLKKSFDNFINSINWDNIIGDVNNTTYSNPWDMFVDVMSSSFNYLGSSIVNFFKFLYYILSMPFRLIFDIVNLVFQYIKIFIDFISYIINFDGYYVVPIS